MSESLRVLIFVTTILGCLAAISLLAIIVGKIIYKLLSPPDPYAGYDAYDDEWDDAD